MNVYDFDKTIYRGDSTVDFWRHCLRRYPGAARCCRARWQRQLAFRQGRCSREQFKERFYQFLRFVPGGGAGSGTLLGPPSYWYRAVVPGTAIEYGRDYFRFAGFFDRRGLPPPGCALSRFAGGRAYRTAVGTELPGRRKSAALPERLRRGGGGTVLFRLLF